MYKEEKDLTKAYKEDYVKGFKNIIEERKKIVDAIRDEYTADIFTDQEKYRREFKEMLGWPLVEYTTEKLPDVSSKLLSKEDGYSIYRMRFEILDGLWMYGLLFKQDKEEPSPLVVVQHGGNGTPELISGIYGDTGVYNDMLQRIRKLGVHVFAPQLLLWSDVYNIEYNRLEIDAALKRMGSSQVAVEIFGITRMLDYFEKQDYVSCFGMVGMSWGGFYTIYVTAIDTRVKSAISCSFFNKRSEVPWTEWTWFKSGLKFDDAEVACMVYPRKLHIEIGDKDALFDYKNGVESFEKLKKMCNKVGTDWVEFKVFDGTHEFFKDDAPIQKLVNDLNMIS